MLGLDVPRTLVRADEVIEQAVDFAALRPVAIGNCLRSLRGTESVDIGGTADTNRRFASANSVEIDPQAT